MKNKIAVLVMSMCLGGLVTNADESAANVIEIQPRDFTSSYLMEEEGKALENIKKNNAFREWAFAEFDYEFNVPSAGWWEFWLQGNSSPFDLIIDGRRLIHAPIPSGVWTPEKDFQKMINVHLSAGKHTLRLSKPEPYGIPGISKMQFRKAKDITGMVRTELVGDCTAIRKGEGLSLKLVAGKGAEAQTVKVTAYPENSKESVWSENLEIPTGEGIFEKLVKLPDGKEGSFDVKFTDKQGRPVDRTIQYLVVDVKNAPKLDKEPKRELIQEIDCSRQSPDYASDETKVINAPFGAYRESGDKGRQGYNMNADWFAYKLKLPSVQDLYLAEIDYPDDDERVTVISLLEKDLNPYCLTLGYASGGIYSLSNKMQTQLFYFYPREQEPRMFFQTWKTGMKSAAAKIRIYKLDGVPAGLNIDLKGRTFGGYQEENIRFTTHYGSTPDGNGWNNYFKALNRFGMHYRSLGGNFWQPTIGNYQEYLWPSKTTKGYAAPDMPGYALVGPQTLNDPVAKDIVRLQLLVCEKYGMGMIGELHIPPNRAFQRHMDKVFGGKATIADNGPHKPWLAVSKTGECSLNSLNKPYWNVFYPGVQDWAASVVSEIAGRYKDSPAFKGVCVRLMSWVFGGWQTVASIDWGYEDCTTDLFQKETGVKIPVTSTGPDRFAKRYEWLMANAYDKWVNWRCEKIYAYHSRLAKILTDARPDLKLYISAYGPIYDRDYDKVTEWKDTTWKKLIKEAGVDTELYNKNPSIFVQNVVIYPSSYSRAKTSVGAAVGRDQNSDMDAIRATAHEMEGGGTCNVLHLDAESFEGNFVSENKSVGYNEPFKGQNKILCGNGVVSPAGVHCMDRYADAMAAGNVISISDGSHGYDQQQPQYLKPFIAEYRSLPVMGMSPVERDADPVAVWQGVENKKMYFYVVNRIDQPVEATLRFEGSPSPVRLSTKEKQKVESGTLKLTLAPYELRSFEGGPANVKILEVKAEAPESMKAELLKQIAFSEVLASGRNQETTLIHISLVELKRTEELLAKAKDAVGKGRVWTARHILLSAELTKLYDAFHAYPPGLYFKKAPAAPKGAMLAPALRGSVTADTKQTQVLDASRLAPALSGIQAFRWTADSVIIPKQEMFSSSSRLELVYVNGNGFAAPTIKVDGKEIPANKLVSEEGVSWGKLVSLEPLSLAAGAHRIELSKKAGSDAAVIYLNVEATPRDLLASDWMAIGPFEGIKDARDTKELAEKMEAKLLPEISRDFSASYKGLGGKNISWFRPTIKSDYVDFYKLTSEYGKVIGYAVCLLDCPKSRDAQIGFGSDYFAKVWVNNEEIFNNVLTHAGPPAKNEYSIPVRLLEGRNEIMVKIHAGSQGNGFWMSISDPGDLKIASK
ncbi:MAG: family 10 glycosylhydrolase [Victivallales bacterium]